jgi:hypothetical protein
MAEAGVPCDLGYVMQIYYAVLFQHPQAYSECIFDGKTLKLQS